MSALAEVDDVRFLLLGTITISGALFAVRQRIPGPPAEGDQATAFYSLCCFSGALVIWVAFCCFIRLRLPTELQVFRNSAQYLQYRKLVNESEWTTEKAAEYATAFHELTRMNTVEKTVSAAAMVATATTFIAGVALFLSEYARVLPR